ncbi:unnamed protein product [Discosporangium mesarthrocarpum]
MKDVGFWGDPRDRDDHRPHPVSFVDPGWDASEREAVALYLRSGYVESFELGYSFCRFGCRGSRDVGKQGSRSRDSKAHTVEMGCCTLTDGEYVWPEGYVHYIQSHAVRPPKDFVIRALENLEVLRKNQTTGRKAWATEEGRLRVMDSGTAAFLQESTTLGMSVPSSSSAPSLPKALGGCYIA